MMYTIYRIKNRLNGKSYIGYTRECPPERRFAGHKRESNKTRANSHLYKAMRKDGIENFAFDVLCWGEDHEAGLKIAEPLMIELFPHEYNMTKGGDGVVGYSHTDEWKKDQSERHKGSKKPGTAAYMKGKKHFLGHKMTPSNVEILRKRMTGNKNAEGMIHTPEWRAHHSRQLLGRPKPSVECPHCGKIGGVSVMMRWHFDKCRKKS